MTTKRKPPPQEFTISAGLIKWAVGIIVLILGGVVSWFAVWDRIDSHWRLETVQAANDKRIDADIKQAREKAENDTKALARNAEVGRAWVRSSIVDTKAYTAAQFARICHALRLPAEECERQKVEADQFRQEAADAKREALVTGKEK